MSSWLESVAAAAVAVMAFLLGRWLSRRPGRWWLIGYFIPLGLVLLYCLAMFEPRLALVPPLSWLMVGRSRFVWFNFIAVLLVCAPLAKVPQKRTRIALFALMIVLTSASILPFLAPAFNRSYLAGLKTRIDPDGICRQSNDYTCCPAAAVTVLRKLGLPAEEGELAILAHTSSLTGTEPDVLAKVLQRRYGRDGLVAEYRAFKNVAELKGAGLLVAVLKFNALQDHCVAVLGLERNRVSVGDPLIGLTSMSVEEFESKWLFVGVVMNRIRADSTTRCKKTAADSLEGLWL